MRMTTSPTSEVTLCIMVIDQRDAPVRLAGDMQHHLEYTMEYLSTTLRLPLSTEYK